MASTSCHNQQWNHGGQIARLKTNDLSNRSAVLNSAGTHQFILPTRHFKAQLGVDRLFHMLKIPALEASRLNYYVA